MQEACDGVRHALNGIDHAGDFGLDAVHKALDEVFSPSQGFAGQACDEVNRRLKSVHNGIPHTPNGGGNAVLHVLERLLYPRHHVVHSIAEPLAVVI